MSNNPIRVNKGFASIKAEIAINGLNELQEALNACFDEIDDKHQSTISRLNVQNDRLVGLSNRINRMEATPESAAVTAPVLAIRDRVASCDAAVSALSIDLNHVKNLVGEIDSAELKGTGEAHRMQIADLQTTAKTTKAAIDLHAECLDGLTKRIRALENITINTYNESDEANVAAAKRLETLWRGQISHGRTLGRAVERVTSLETWKHTVSSQFDRINDLITKMVAGTIKIDDIRDMPQPPTMHDKTVYADDGGPYDPFQHSIIQTAEYERLKQQDAIVKMLAQAGIIQPSEPQQTVALG